MILSDDEIKERIESPLNLLNRLRTAIRPPNIPSLPPKAEDIVADLDDKLKNTSARNKANSIMLAAMGELENRIPEIHKPETLAKIAYDMSRVVSSHDDARRNHGTINSQIIVYAPQVQKIEDFDIIDVVE